MRRRVGCPASTPFGLVCELEIAHDDWHRNGAWSWSGAGGARARRRIARARLRAARQQYLASKPRCWCGRVGVASCWAFFPDTGESKREWACRRHVEPVEGMDEPDLEPCMCEWEGGCGGLGVVYCRGCGGDNCVCICGGGPAECEGCEECGPLIDSCDDFFEDEDETQQSPRGDEET